MSLSRLAPALVPIALVAAAAAPAATPREILVEAAFVTRDRAAAAAEIEAARAAGQAALARNPADREAKLQMALAIGYRATLNKNRADALAARKLIEELAAADPRDPETQMAIAGWHLNSIDELGAMMARTALGARKAVGDAALGRAVALGGRSAAMTGMAALMQIRGNPAAVAQARALAERAVALPAATPLDRVMQRAAGLVLPALKANDGPRAAALARRLLPFGSLPKK